MELERIEGNKSIYRDKGKTITVIKEFPVNIDVNVSSVLETLIGIIEQEEKDNDANAE